METRAEPRAGWIELTRAGIHVLAKGDEQLRHRLTVALGAAGGDALPDVLTDELTRGGIRATPDFAIVDVEGGRVLARGTARVVLTALDGMTREVAGPIRAPWTDEDIDGGLTEAVLLTGQPEDQPEAPVEPVAAAAPPEPAAERPRFVDGHLVSAAVAAAVAERASAPAEAEPEVAAVPDTGSGTGVMPVGGGAPSEAPATDGPLQLSLSSGEVVPVDRGIVLGRAPKAAAAIGAAGEPHLVRVPSPDNEISRSHVEVYPEGDGVVVRDLGSTNGTTITAPGGQPSRLSPGAPHPFALGDRLVLAGHVEVLLEEA